MARQYSFAFPFCILNNPVINFELSQREKKRVIFIVFIFSLSILIKG
jgi:hypothetical protein